MLLALAFFLFYVKRKFANRCLHKLWPAKTELPSVRNARSAHFVSIMKRVELKYVNCIKTTLYYIRYT